jgi:hypothetical protein
MSRAKMLFGVLGTTVLMLGAAATQGIELPAGPDREVVSRECQACHDLAMVVGSTGLTREGWNSVIDEMTSYGLHVTPQERAKILDYLSTYLGRVSTPSKASQ